MSELLYECCQRSPSLRPLVFAVRTWACAAGIRANGAGPWPSNFTLTLLVMYFLQSQSLLCPISQLSSHPHRTHAASTATSAASQPHSPLPRDDSALGTVEEDIVTISDSGFLLNSRQVIAASFASL